MGKVNALALDEQIEREEAELREQGYEFCERCGEISNPENLTVSGYCEHCADDMGAK